MFLQLTRASRSRDSRSVGMARTLVKRRVMIGRVKNCILIDFWRGCCGLVFGYLVIWLLSVCCCDCVSVNVDDVESNSRGIISILYIFEFSPVL